MRSSILIFETGMVGERCIEYDTCFEEGDRVQIRMDCNGTQESMRWRSAPPLINTSILTNTRKSVPTKEEEEEKIEDNTDDNENENIDEDVDVDTEETNEEAVDEDYQPENGRKQEEVFGSLLQVENGPQKLDRTTIVWNQQTILSRKNGK